MPGVPPMLQAVLGCAVLFRVYIIYRVYHNVTWVCSGVRGVPHISDVPRCYRQYSGVPWCRINAGGCTTWYTYTYISYLHSTQQSARCTEAVYVINRRPTASR